MCSEVNDFIMELVKELNFPSICEDNLPLPTLKCLEKLKEDHEKSGTKIMALNDQTKEIAEEFSMAPTKSIF